MGLSTVDDLWDDGAKLGLDDYTTFSINEIARLDFFFSFFYSW